MEVIYVAWAVLKFFGWLVWMGVFGVWLCLAHIGILATVVGVLWAVIAKINRPISPAPQDAPSPWWGVLIAVVGAAIAYVQYNWA